MTSAATGGALLGPGDPPAVETHDATGSIPVLLTCDHASRAVPASLERLGLDEATLARHIGWDIGAAAVTRHLARILDAPAILGGYSRLVVDCNRTPDDPTSIPATSDGVTVPGNRHLSAEARRSRIATLFEPYHAAIARRLDAWAAHGTVPALLSIHSFTPVMNGFVRPWHVGILWDRDPRIPVPLMASLAADPALVVGDNEPYSARSPAGYTTATHALARGLPHVAVELRQDLLGDEAGIREWAGRLAAALRPILADPALYRIERY